MVALLTVISEVPLQAQSNAPLVVQVQAPTQVRVGEAFSLTLVVSGASESIAGMEAMALFDPAAAEFSAFYPSAGSAQTGLGTLIMPESPAGAAVGYYTCSTPECSEVGGALAAMATAGVASLTPNTLATVEILPLVAGQLEVRLDNLQLVGASGDPMPVQLEQSSVIVQVGEGGDPHPAPSKLLDIAAVQAASEASAAAVDLTGDGVISHADLMETAMSWEIVREQSAGCAGIEPTADLNHDGCVTVADVQLAASRIGTPLPDNEPPLVDPSAFPNQLYLPSLQGNATLSSSDASSDGDASATAESAEGVNSAEALTFVVNSVSDSGDAKIGDGLCRTASGVCTLRAAIAEANSHSGADTINFAIPGSGVHTIQLNTHLPSLSDSSGGTTINGYTQPGSAVNTHASVSNARIMVEIRGQDLSFDALPITSANNVVKGLSFYFFRKSLWIYGAGAKQNVIVGNFLGTNAASTFVATNTTTQQAHGILIEQGAQHNKIGGTTPAERNVISGNRRSGIGMWHWPTSYNTVYNNLVGLSADGAHDLGNRTHGIDMNFGASNNIVGGTADGQRNVVSGNSFQGIEVSHANSTANNQVIGNYVGTYPSGNVAGGFTKNGGYGVVVKDRAQNNTVAYNVISNNILGGLNIDNFGTCCLQGNVFENNRIGIGINGAAMGNSGNGVSVTAPNSRIGPGNIIANNSAGGIVVSGDANDKNQITQNSIFANGGLGIDLAPTGAVNPNDAGDGDTGANEQLNFPVIKQAHVTQVTGTACAGCRVEIFIATGAAGANGQGQTYVGNAKAATNGAFTANVTGVALGNRVTATAIDAAGNTSEFSVNVVVN